MTHDRRKRLNLRAIRKEAMSGVAGMIRILIVISPGLLPLLVYAASEILLTNSTTFGLDIGIRPGGGQIQFHSSVAGQ